MEAAGPRDTEYRGCPAARTSTGSPPALICRLAIVHFRPYGFSVFRPRSPGLRIGIFDPEVALPGPLARPAQRASLTLRVSSSEVWRTGWRLSGLCATPMPR